MVRVGAGEWRRSRQQGGQQQSGVGHAAHNAGAGPGDAGQVGGGARFAVCQGVEDFLAGFGDADFGGRGIDAVPAGGGRADGGGHDAQGHRHDLAGRRQGVAGHPVDELAQRRAHRRGVEYGGDRLQLAVRHAGVGGGVPDDADFLAAVEGHQHDVAGFRVQVGRDPIVEWAGKRVRQHDRHTLHCSVCPRRPAEGHPPSLGSAALGWRDGSCGGEDLDHAAIPPPPFPSYRGSGKPQPRPGPRPGPDQDFNQSQNRTPRCGCIRWLACILSVAAQHPI